jgi:hypothetical protein
VVRALEHDKFEISVVATAPPHGSLRFDCRPTLSVHRLDVLTDYIAGPWPLSNTSCRPGGRRMYELGRVMTTTDHEASATAVKFPRPSGPSRCRGVGRSQNRAADPAPPIWSAFSLHLRRVPQRPALRSRSLPVPTSRPRRMDPLRRRDSPLHRRGLRDHGGEGFCETCCVTMSSALRTPATSARGGCRTFTWGAGAHSTQTGIRHRYRLGSDRGSPNHGNTLLSKRVKALIRSPVTVSTKRPLPWRTPVEARRYAPKAG